VATPRSDRSAAIAATAASTAMVAFQLAGKATRDALYLSTFGVAALPRMVIAASLLSALVTIGLSRAMARIGPGRLVPRLFALSALFLMLEWALAGAMRPAAAAVFYLHFTSLGALLVSGFWAMVTERFDPRAARGTVGRITAGASVGGLLGGILPERVGAGLPVTAMLPILAGLHLLCAMVVLGVRSTGPTRPGPVTGGAEADSATSARQAFRASPHLRLLALLIALTALAEGLLDFVFKVRATAEVPSGEQLLRLFAVFYTATALLTILLQTTALRPALAYLGVARSAGLLPAGVSLGALGGLFLPGLLPLLVARGTEIVLRNSVFRGAYELLFTPVTPREKRATKLLVDVGAARMGDVAGGALIQATLLVAAASAGQLLLGATMVVAFAALAVARRLHGGYVGALARNLELQAGPVPGVSADDAAALLQTVGGFDLSQLRSPNPGSGPVAAPPPIPAPRDRNSDRWNSRLRALEGAEPAEVRDALLDGALTAPLMEQAIALLAWDAVASTAVQALRAVARSETPRLVRHLLDPDEDFAVRRRLVLALAECPTPEAFEGLLKALGDRRFEVRYRAGRALNHLVGQIPGLVVDRDRVLRAVLNEVAVGRGVWESRQLIDAADDLWAPGEAELLRHRASRSLEHVFALLALILPSEPLRLAYHGLHTDDRNLRGTALEYLESILPDQVREKLWPFLEPEASPARPAGRNPDQVLANLLQSRESIVLALADVRRRSGGMPG
jgi:ATP:ADP antiporter, AAA family